MKYTTSERSWPQWGLYLRLWGSDEADLRDVYNRTPQITTHVSDKRSSAFPPLWSLGGKRALMELLVVDRSHEPCGLCVGWEGVANDVGSRPAALSLRLDNDGIFLFSPPCTV